MRITSKSIGIRAVLAPFLAAVVAAALIAVLVPSDGADGAGVTGVLAILAGAICVGGVAVWSLVTSPRKHEPTVLQSQASPRGEVRPAVLGTNLPSPAYAAAVTLTVITLAQAGSYEMPAPTQDESLRLDKAANGTPDPGVDEKVGA